MLRITAKGGLSFRGGSLHDGFGGFDGFGGSGEHLALLLLVLQNTAQRGNRGGFDGLAVSAVMAVSVVKATPLKLNPLFRDPDMPCQMFGQVGWDKGDRALSD